MKLVIFDLDGTLTKTFAIDEQCFVQAFADALGINAVNRNWSEYEHVTDSGVLQEVFRKSLGRAPEASEVAAFVQCFVGSLNHHYCKSIDDFGEVPGAASMLVTLKENSDWGAAIATGSWERSARFKMKAAGIDADPLPAPLQKMDRHEKASCKPQLREPQSFIARALLKRSCPLVTPCGIYGRQGGLVCRS